MICFPWLLELVTVNVTARTASIYFPTRSSGLHWSSALGTPAEITVSAGLTPAWSSERGRLAGC